MVLEKIKKEKICRKLRGTLVKSLKGHAALLWIYPSCWHAVFTHRAGNAAGTDNIYFTARPNPGAGIGHQMANWIAGYHFAKVFGLKFAHYPFSDSGWEHFLGFGESLKSINALKTEGWKVRRIPLFDEHSSQEVERVKHIMASYGNEKIVFLAEQDQFYKLQYEESNELSEMFYQASARKNDQLIYDPTCFNIAVHVRRGDIIQKPGENNPNLTMRMQSNQYFVNALHTALEYLKGKENIRIYLFSQGKPEDFPEFDQFADLHYCLDMGAQESFLHMVYSDALITSKSSFSYKPALLNQGIKFCPAEFWHGYPDSCDWVLLDQDGHIAR